MRCVVKSYHLLAVCMAYGVLIDQVPLVETITFTAIGIKLCQFKCIQYGCRGIRYNIETLKCHLSEKVTQMISEDTEDFFDPTHLSDVKVGICTLDTCRGMRCLETHAGKTVCIKDEHDQIHNGTFVNTTLFDACSLGDLHQVKYILSRDHTNINLRDHSGKTPAMIAAVTGHRAVLELLLEKGANCSLLDDEDNSIFHVACIEGNLDIVKYIHSQNIIDIDSSGGNGTTPLMFAALSGKMEVFDFLINMGADTSAKDDADRTILHWACQGGNLKIVDYVLTQTTVDINSNDRKKMTPLLLAAYHGERDVVGLLLGKGANTFALDHNSRNILHLSCSGGHVDTVRYVLNQTSVDINSKDYAKMTPLLLAAYKGNREVFDILVRKGADLSVVNDRGNNILHCACQGGKVEIVNYILEQNIVHIDSIGEREMTPVMRAAYQGKREVFDCLVKQGAELLISDEGDNILHLACQGGNVQIVKYILMHNIEDINSIGCKGMSPVLNTAYYGKREVFELLVNQGADLTVVDRNGDNILHLACRGGNVEIVKYILMHNIEDINSIGFKGMSPVLNTAYYGKGEVFELLVNQGADLTVVDRNGDNILHLACQGGKVEIVDYILAQNFLNINTKGYNGMSPVLQSVKYEKREVFGFLVKQGADLSVADKNGDNIFHLVCLKDMTMVKYILTQTTMGFNSRNNKSMTPLLKAACHGKRDTLEIFLAAGANTSAVDHKGNNILHLSCTYGRVGTVKYILDQNIVDIDSKNFVGMTPVMIAAFSRQREVFNVLVKKGANLSESDEDGDNILHLACMKRQKEIVKNVLRLQIVDINSRGYEGMTALLYAAEYCVPYVFDLLLESRADTLVLNTNGDNVLHLASGSGCDEVVKSVLSRTSVNITMKNKEGLNAAEIARVHGHMSTTKLLLQASQ